MLTRLKVSGFKNLVDVDVRFGAFTCIAGANGVGKSNLFDAIRFLSASAQMPLMEAALSIRDGNGKASDVRNLFHRVGDRYVNKMSFEAEIIISTEEINDREQKIEVTENFLIYSLEISYKEDSNYLNNKLEVSKEKLVAVDRNYINKYSFLRKYPISNINDRAIDIIYGDTTEGNRSTKAVYVFPNGKNDRISIPQVIRKFSETFVSHWKGRHPVLGPGSVISILYKEISAWQLLQLEPSPLRKPNEFIASGKLGKNGSNLAASFYYLVAKSYQQDVDKIKYKVEEIEAKVYAQVSIWQILGET